ncbi:MAG: hypothetical protein ABSF71_31620 [Terriglobia bacterium]|jgi:hypothetical protein
MGSLVPAQLGVVQIPLGLWQRSQDYFINLSGCTIGGAAEVG